MNVKMMNSRPDNKDGRDENLNLSPSHNPPEVDARTSDPGEAKTPETVCGAFLSRLGFPASTSRRASDGKDLTNDRVGRLRAEISPGTTVPEEAIGLLARRECLKVFAATVRRTQIDYVLGLDENNELRSAKPLQARVELAVFQQLDPTRDEGTPAGAWFDVEQWGIPDDKLKSETPPDLFLTYFVSAMLDQEQGAHPLRLALKIAELRAGGTSG